jgi:hypothetical protein
MPKRAKTQEGVVYKASVVDVTVVNLITNPLKQSDGGIHIRTFIAIPHLVIIPASDGVIRLNIDACCFRIQYIPLARPRPCGKPRAIRVSHVRLAVSVIGRHALCLLSDPNIGSGANLWNRA